MPPLSRAMPALALGLIHLPLVFIVGWETSVWQCVLQTPMTVREDHNKRPIPSNPSIAELPNLGPKSAAALCAAGIDSVAQLRKIGYVAAYSRAKRHDPRVSLNLLWAIEGALTGLPWQVVARDHRTSLLLALDEYERGV